MTFREFYQTQPKGYKVLRSKAAEFVEEIAKITKKNPRTVRQWISGAQYPDALARTIIAEFLGISEEELFPDAKR